MHLEQIVKGTQKWHWNLSRHSGFLAMDQMFKILFLSITQEPLGLRKFNAILSSLGNLLWDAYIILQKDVDRFEIENKLNMLISG